LKEVVSRANVVKYIAIFLEEAVGTSQSKMINGKRTTTKKLQQAQA